MATGVSPSQLQLYLESHVGEQTRGDSGETQSRTRPLVRITVYTIQLYDEVDNLKAACKFLIDQLRYSKLIRGDRATETDFTITQVKVSKRNEIGTRVEVIHPETEPKTDF
jgi:hypothetical protein